MALSCNKKHIWIIKKSNVKSYGDFYCLNCFHLYRTKGKLKKHERICYGNKFCFLKMPDADNNILKENQEKNH